MVAFAPPPSVPVRLHLGESSVDLGSVSVAMEARVTTRDDGTVGAVLAVTDGALLREQLANLLEHAARELRKGADDDAAPAAR